MPILRVKIGSGAPQAALPAPSATSGASVVMSLDTTVGYASILWRITHCPDGYNPGGSWVQNGTSWEANGPLSGSPSFSLTDFETFLLEAVCKDDRGVVLATFVGGVCVPGLTGIRKLAYQEQQQVDLARHWARSIRELQDRFDGLVGVQSGSSARLWMRFQEASGNLVNDGTSGGSMTVSGSARYGVPGPIGKSVVLPLTVSASGLTGLILGTGDFTILLSVTMRELTAPRTLLRCRRGSDATDVLLIGAEGDVQVLIHTGTGTGTDYTLSSGNVVAYAPTHLAIVHDSAGNKLALYWNGDKVASVPTTNAVAWIGETGSNTWYLNSSDVGDVIYHEVLGFDSALTAAQIQERARRFLGYRS